MNHLEANLLIFRVFRVWFYEVPIYEVKIALFHLSGEIFDVQTGRGFTRVIILEYRQHPSVCKMIDFISKR